MLSQISSHAVDLDRNHNPAGPVSGGSDAGLDGRNLVTPSEPNSLRNTVRTAANAAASQSDPSQATISVSYNTRVFNREITALRSEEDALLQF